MEENSGGDVAVDGRKILEWFSGKWEVVKCSHLAPDSD
jgi:hypothetical protein